MLFVQVNYTPLAIACQNGMHEFIKMMIEEDPDLRLDGEPEVNPAPRLSVYLQLENSSSIRSY